MLSGMIDKIRVRDVASWRRQMNTLSCAGTLCICLGDLTGQCACA